MIPESLKAYIGEKLEESVISARMVSGGSINQAAKVELSSGATCFLKWNTDNDPDMFAREVEGLKLLSDARTSLIIPKVLLQDVLDESTGFLLQEFVPEGKPKPDSPKNFGYALSHLHRTRAEKYGLNHDNYIGYLPQSNTQHSDWISFFIDERLEPQLKMAVDDSKLNPSITDTFQNLYRRLPDIFPDEPPSLLHGDLWGGNYFYGTEGQPVIFDPAVYFGHREMELAFTRLFGGFSGEFYQSYQESYPLEPGFESRKDLYNLYPLLVHTNIFGGSYARQVEGIVRIFG